MLKLSGEISDLLNNVESEDLSLSDAIVELKIIYNQTKRINDDEIKALAAKRDVLITEIKNEIKNGIKNGSKDGSESAPKEASIEETNNEETNNEEINNEETNNEETNNEEINNEEINIEDEAP